MIDNARKHFNLYRMAMMMLLSEFYKAWYLTSIQMPHVDANISIDSQKSHRQNNMLIHRASPISIDILLETQ